MKLLAKMKVKCYGKIYISPILYLYFIHTGRGLPVEGLARRVQLVGPLGSLSSKCELREIIPINQTIGSSI